MPGDLRGLTGRQPEILGLLIDDRSDRRIAAARDMPLRAVTEIVEQILTKLAAPTRALATCGHSAKACTSRDRSAGSA